MKNKINEKLIHRICSKKEMYLLEFEYLVIGVVFCKANMLEIPTGIEDNTNE